MQIHGGQDINLKINLKEDFSVTTNYLGLSNKGILQIKNYNDLTHYPSQNQEPFKSEMINWLYKNQKSKNKFLLFGNGASELIELLIKTIRFDPINNIYKSKNWKPGSSTVQYIEYERTCSNYQYNKKSYDCYNTDITCIINPCNPTGEYKNIIELKKYIETYCKDNSIVIVDESMQLWVGEHFREDSLLSQNEWINKLYNEKKIGVFIIHSWTKFFCCTGLRIGSLICPNNFYYELLLKYSIPWSCNIFALKYLNGCINDEIYMKTTWKLTKKYRKYIVDNLKDMYPNWLIFGNDFLSWVWIDTLSEQFALLIYNMCKLNGIPIRLGTNGYNLPTYIRIAVRKKKNVDILLEVLESLKIFYDFKYPHIKLPSNLIIKTETINIDRILCHEYVVENRMNSLYDYLQSLENTKIIPSIIIDINTNVLIDGHHRLSVLKKLNYSNVSVLFINYNHPNIIVHPTENITKEQVVSAALENKLLKPKSTQHMIKDEDNHLHPIVVLSNLYSLKNS